MSDVPQFLLEGDEGSGSRWRESVSVSVIAHLVFIVFILVQPMLSKPLRGMLGIPAEEPQPKRQLTYLAMPPDDQVVARKPKTGFPSDKDRTARPGLDPDRLKLPPVPRPPPPAKEADKPLLAQVQPPQLPNVPPQLPPVAQPSPGQPAAQASPELRLEQPKLAVPQPGVPGATGTTPGRALDDIVRGMARNRDGGQAVGDSPGVPGINPRAPAAVGEARILSDTMGVDFNPYLRRVVADIRRNWYAVMPEIARLGKRGRVIVVFEVNRDGSVAKLYLVASSLSEPLDRAALAGISASVPFPPLPPEFRGPLVRLQVTFLYNMFGIEQ